MESTNNLIYLDHSATTPLCESAKQALLLAVEQYGNPSSLHEMGLAANRAVSQARDCLYAALGVPSSEVVDSRLPLGGGNPEGKRFFFTSCGTEADNLVIFGLLHGKKFRKIPRVILTDSEHPAMGKALERLEREGAVELVRLSTLGGRLNLSELEEALTENTLLVSIMTVNNETGAQYEVKQAFALAKRKVPQVVTHTDAVQGFLKTDLSFHKIGADLVTVSGHKIGATKGIGGLLVSNRILKAGRLAPLIFGGGQEGGLRSGTENVPGILSFGAAARTGKAELPVFLSQMAHLREIFLSALPKEIAVNQPQGAFAPHIISIRLPKIKSETMLRFLSEAGICVSSGSACSSHGGHDSYVLRAFGLTEEEADCTLRISMGLENTEKELLLTAQKLEEGLHILARRS